MPDVSDIQETGIPPVDSLAEREVKSLISRARRKEEMEGVAHKITKFLLWVTVIIIVVVGVCRLLHLILPEHYQWLSPEGIGKIDEFFIHGTVGAIIVEFLRGKISAEKEN